MLPEPAADDIENRNLVLEPLTTVRPCSGSLYLVYILSMIVGIHS